MVKNIERKGGLHLNELDYDPAKYAKRGRNGELPDVPDDIPSLEDVTIPDADSEYNKPYGNVRRVAVPTLHCIRGKEGYDSFTYQSLGRRHSFKHVASGHEIVLEFVDGERTRVTIRGRNLLKLYDYILQHRMPYVREADRDFANGREPIITAIVIDEVGNE